MYPISWVHACSRWTDVYSNDSMELEMKVRENIFIFLNIFKLYVLHLRTQDILTFATILLLYNILGPT